MGTIFGINLASLLTLLALFSLVECHLLIFAQQGFLEGWLKYTAQ